ncbi:MAG: hypothetical protein M5U19_14505 [Microthrixaceae bacterium]|nr:hypothetical protein [Microthrixaceae bacterium]
MDPYAGLAEPDGVPFTVIDTVDERLAEVDHRDKVRFAMDLDSRITEADTRIVGHEGADYSDASSVTAIASTTGVRAGEQETMAHAAIHALASDGDEVTTGFGLSFSRGFEGLDPDEVIDEAVERCTAMFGAAKTGSAAHGGARSIRDLATPRCGGRDVLRETRWCVVARRSPTVWGSSSPHPCSSCATIHSMRPRSPPCRLTGRAWRRAWSP